jgi:hypothetical protein
VAVLAPPKTANGNIKIDPAELFRAFEPVPAQQSAGEPAKQVATGAEEALVDQLEREIAHLREMLSAMEREKKNWREAHITSLRALPAPERRSWWSRFRAAG